MVFNKNGQTLIMFIILLPILLGITAFVIDYGIIVYEKNRLDNLINYSQEKDKNIDKLLIDNDIKKYKKKENGSCYQKTCYKNSLFVSIVGKEEIKITSTNCRNEGNL